MSKSPHNVLNGKCALSAPFAVLGVLVATLALALFMGIGLIQPEKAYAQVNDDVTAASTPETKGNDQPANTANGTGETTSDPGGGGSTTGVPDSGAAGNDSNLEGADSSAPSACSGGAENGSQNAENGSDAAVEGAGGTSGTTAGNSNADSSALGSDQEKDGADSESKAKKTYTVTFVDANGNVISTQQVTCEDTGFVTMPAFTAPDGKVFAGWSGPGGLSAAGSQVKISSDSTFTAVLEDEEGVDQHAEETQATSVNQPAATGADNREEDASDAAPEGGRFSDDPANDNESVYWAWDAETATLTIGAVAGSTSDAALDVNIDDASLLPWLFSSGFDKAKVRSVVFAPSANSLGSPLLIRPLSLTDWFAGFTSLELFDGTGLDLSRITSIAGIFAGDSALKTVIGIPENLLADSGFGLSDADETANSGTADSTQNDGMLATETPGSDMIASTNASTSNSSAGAPTLPISIGHGPSRPRP